MQAEVLTVAEVAWAAEAQLGEGPVWDDESATVLWLDIKGRRLHAYDVESNQKRSVALATEVGSIALRRAGGLVAATRDGFAFLDPTTGAMSVLADPEAHLPENRFNDGKCDTAGRFIAGTMHDPETSPAGAVYSLNGDGAVRCLFGGYVVCNGPAFSPDGRTLYFCDSAKRTVLAFDYDSVSGAVGRSRVFARFPPDQGYPDGITVDQEGCLWCAHWDGWRVTRFRPDGREAMVITMPVPRPTSCVFGGRDLDRLYVTSARIGLEEKALRAAPLSGALFCVPVAARGVPAARFSG